MPDQKRKVYVLTTEHNLMGDSFFEVLSVFADKEEASVEARRVEAEDRNVTVSVVESNLIKGGY